MLHFPVGARCQSSPVSLWSGFKTIGSSRDSWREIRMLTVNGKHQFATAMHSISTLALSANPLPATVDRAGGSVGKNSRYTVFIAA